MVINGAIVSDLDMMFIESVLQEEISLCMMMRSCRTGEGGDVVTRTFPGREDELRNLMPCSIYPVFGCNCLKNLRQCACFSADFGRLGITVLQ